MKVASTVRMALAVGIVLCVPPWAAVRGQVDGPDEATRRARGEVRYEEKWITIRDLFDMFQTAQKEMAGLVDTNKAAQERIADLNKQNSQIQADYRKNKAALDAEMAGIVAAGRAAQSRFNTVAPVRPLQPSPYGPDRALFPDRASYRAAYDYWLASTIDYSRRLDEYNKLQAQWESDHAAAATDIRVGLVAVKDCQKRLDELLAARKENEKPVLTEQQKISEEMRPLVARSNLLRTKIKTVSDALRTAPETLLMAMGVLVWHDTIYTVTDFQAMADKLNADIDAARRKFTQNAGGTLPATWRHPKQDEADAMAAMLAKARAASPTASAPSPPPPLVPPPPQRPI
jgi:predicted  nucleic acid-binding Zn-ribbon protein